MYRMDQETIEQLESGEIKRQEVIQIELNKYFEKLGVMPKLTLKKRRMKISEALTKYSYDNQLWNNLSSMLETKYTESYNDYE